ncbi:flagellin [Natrinema salsiterrestre]|uniref:Flagellin n=1 Tax=Natrinema salsiterrestre TaxID=2950540 RepID=A0A9Q4L0N2_9EURY|nr:flagellin [Natrinema salsiterrestre]MDF9744658.1 flagellin [Natrinema salsiterrestre]
MGFSTSGATAIIFVGVLVAAGIAYPVFQTAYEERTTAIENHDDRALEMRNTAIEIASTSYDANGNGNFTMDVNNTGSTVLSVSETDLLLDGVYQESYETSVNGTADRELWQPGETLTVTVSTERPNRVKIVTEHGIAATEVL